MTGCVVLYCTVLCSAMVNCLPFVFVSFHERVKLESAEKVDFTSGVGVHAVGIWATRS